MRRHGALGLAAWAAAAAVSSAAVSPAAVPIAGAVEQGEDVSGVASAGALLVVAADEGAAIQVLRGDLAGYTPSPPIRLLPDPGSDVELDLEGLEVADRGDGTLSVFATGSHGTARRTVKDDKTVEKNRERLAEVRPEPDRSRYFRLTLDAATGERRGEVASGSLSSFFAASPYFAAQLPGRPPSKEGGIDVEGLAVAPDGRLVFGLRGPVLLGGWAVVLVAPFERPDDAEVRFLPLGGLGIRGLAAVDGGYLVLAGPVGVGDDFRLFFWDGADGLPGSDRGPGGRPVELGPVPVPPGGDGPAKAEGLTVVAESAERYTVLVVYDGVSGGGPTLLTVDKPD
jgi:hypothetical protein